MKKAALFLICFVFLLLAPAGSLAVEDAYEKIRVYTQIEMNEDGTHKYASYAKKYDLYAAGCKVFSLAHGIQWVTGHADSEEEETLREIVDLFSAPRNDTYSKIIEHYKGTDVSIDQGAKYYPTTRQGWMEGFGAGYAYVINVWGHYAVAVDYAVCDETLAFVGEDGTGVPSGCEVYIQIIDSSPTAAFTSSREPTKRAFYNCAWYTLDGDSLEMHEAGSLPGYTGMQYWIRYEDFQHGYNGKLGIRANSTDRCARIHGTWAGHEPFRAEKGGE